MHYISLLHSYDAYMYVRFNTRKAQALLIHVYTLYVVCLELADPSNGSVMISVDGENNKVATYSCDEGFVLSGDSTRECLGNQQWTGNEPTCWTVSCGDPGTPTHGYHNGGAYFFDTQVVYNCESGYVLIGSQILNCTGSGVWNDSAPTCDPVNCGDPGTVKNAQRTGDVFTYPSVVTYSCNEGFYVSSGSSTIECLSNAEWIPKNMLVCAPTGGNTCGDPGTVDNAKRMGDVFTVGSLVMYTCMGGYVIRGSSTIMCTSSNSWNDSLPTCEKLTSQVQTTPLQTSKFHAVCLMLYVYF